MTFSFACGFIDSNKTVDCSFNKERAFTRSRDTNGPAGKSVEQQNMCSECLQMQHGNSISTFSLCLELLHRALTDLKLKLNAKNKIHRRQTQ